jgi:hypothetical protein
MERGRLESGKLFSKSNRHKKFTLLSGWLPVRCRAGCHLEIPEALEILGFYLPDNHDNLKLKEKRKGIQRSAYATNTGFLPPVAGVWLSDERKL